MTSNECLRVGQQAPDFTATAVFDQDFKEVTLSQYKGKYVVLFFYPFDFTFVCPTEICNFSDNRWLPRGRIKNYVSSSNPFEAPESWINAGCAGDIPSIPAACNSKASHERHDIHALTPHWV